MSDSFALRPEILRAHADSDELSDINPHVFNSISEKGEDSSCLRAFETGGNDGFGDDGFGNNGSCFSSWSWDMTKCTDMLPFKVNNKTATGVFMQVSSLAMSHNILPGCLFELRFTPSCEYVLKVLNLDKTAIAHQESGAFNWTRASRTSPTDAIGGNNMYATLELSPENGMDTWGSVWLARLRFEGSFQSKLGIATIVIRS